VTFLLNEAVLGNNNCTIYRAEWLKVRGQHSANDTWNSRRPAAKHYLLL